jgi:hypothetical protein
MVAKNSLKGQCREKSVSKSILGNALDLKYDPLTCLKTFRSSVLKLIFFKSMFIRRKKCFNPLPRTAVEFICGPGQLF